MRSSNGVVYSIKSHLLWCPKYRHPLLAGMVAGRLEELLATKAGEIDAEIHAHEIVPDHVHLFVERSPAHLAHQFKGFTSRQLCQGFPSLRSRLPTLWSRSYFVGSVGTVSEATVRQRGR